MKKYTQSNYEEISNLKFVFTYTYYTLWNSTAYIYDKFLLIINIDKLLMSCEAWSITWGDTLEPKYKI